MKIQYGWVMVAIGAVMTCVAAGAMFSLAVFLQPMTEATIGSFAVGIGAAAIALAFPPFGRQAELRPA